MLDIKTFELYVKEKEQNKTKEENTNQFTNNYDKSKVVDVSSLGIIKKRPRSELKEETNENLNENTNILEDKREKKDESK